MSAEHHNPATEGATHLLLCAAHPPTESCGHPHHLRIDTSPQMLAHGEQHRIRSVTSLRHQLSNMFSDQVCIVCH